MRNRSITQLIIGMVVAVGMSVVAISAIGSPVAQSPVQARAQVIGQEATPNILHSRLRKNSGFRDHQQLKDYFLDGPIQVSLGSGSGETENSFKTKRAFLPVTKTPCIAVRIGNDPD